MSLVRRRIARLEGPASVDTRSTSGSAYATPPRTPAPTTFGDVSSALLSRNISAHQTTSSAGCELASPRPIRVMVSSLLSATDTASSYEASPEMEVIRSIHDDVSPRFQPETAPPVLSPHLDGGVSLHSVFSSSGVEYKQYAASRQASSLSTGSSTLQRGAQETTRAQQTYLHDLGHKFSQMHEEVRLEMRQPSLPAPQLDDLRDRLEALASGLQSADIQGLHVKVDGLKANAQESILHNEAASSSDDVAKKLNDIVSSFEELKVKMEDDRSTLPFIHQKLVAIQEQVEGQDLAPPVPSKDDPSLETNALQDTLGEIQKKLDGLECILADLRKGSETGVAAVHPISIEEPQRSLSIFSKRSSVPSSPPQANEVSPEASSYGFSEAAYH